MREILAHQSGANEVNDQIVIKASPPGRGGAPVAYNVQIGGAILHLPFQNGCLADGIGVNGLTNEVVLAILADRLTEFQGGEFACRENQEALTHVNKALGCLKTRTHRRKEQGVEGKHEKHASEDDQEIPGGCAGAQSRPPLPRVGKTDNRLYLGASGDVAIIDLADLQNWAGWTKVESAVKKLVKASGHLSPFEMSVIKACPITNAGKNGLKEFLSAYDRM